MNQQETRRELIEAARHYIAGEPGSDGVADAYRQMDRLLSAGFIIENNDILIHEIASYIHNPEADEEDCNRMALYVNLPDCPLCGIDGSTAFHPDGTDDEPVLTCMFCGHVGYRTQ